MFKQLSIFCTIFLLTLSISCGDVFSKGFSSSGGGRSSSSSSFRSSSSSSSKSTFSTPSTSYKSAAVGTAAVATTTPKSSSSTQTTSSFWSTKGTKSFAGTSSFDKNQSSAFKAEKANKAKQEYSSNVSKFAKPVTPVYKSTTEVKSSPLFSGVRTRSTDNHSTYYRGRTSYYGNSGWTAPQYVYQSSPSFGMWDGMMLWMMLDHINDDKYAKMAYNHANDPGFQQWKQEAAKLSESNTELKAKLAAMETKVAGMTGEKDLKYLPEGVPATVALSNEALSATDKTKVPFIIATGGEGNNYARTGNLTKAAADSLDVNVIYTNGTVDNLKRFDAKQVDGFIAQNDVMDSLALTDGAAVAKMKAKWTVLFIEPVQMIANKSGGIKKIQDLSKSNVLYIGPAGSGTESTWQRMKSANKNLTSVRTENATYAEALDKVAKDQNAVMMFVSGLNSTTITSAEARAEKDNLRLVSIDDDSFTNIIDVDGNQLYEKTEISSSVYPNLQKGFFFHKDIPTIACKAVFVVNPEWIEKNGEEALVDLTSAIAEARTKMTGILNKNSEN